MLIVKIMLKIIGKSMCSVSKFDPEIKREIASWPENFTFSLKVLPLGPKITIQKTPEGKLKIVKNTKRADLSIVFKNIDAAYEMVTLQKGVAQTYAEKRLIAKGDLAFALSLTRTINRTERYLLPRIFLRKIMQKLPKIPWFWRYIQRIRLFSLTLLFGI